MMLFGRMNVGNGWGPRTRKSARNTLRNVRSAKRNSKLIAKCNELQSELAATQSQMLQIQAERNDIRKQSDECGSQLQHLHSELIRAHSDAQRNKRLATDKESQAAERARIEVAKRVMTVADDFANAIEVAEEQNIDSEWFAGFKAMADKIDKCLVSVGYRRFESLGQDMDPTRHEALATMPTSEALVGKVVQVIEAGYEDEQTSKVVRVAKVLVGRPIDEA